MFFSALTLHTTIATGSPSLRSSTQILGKTICSQVPLVVKNPSANAGDVRDVGLIPELGRSPEGGHGNPLQYSCLENPHGQRSLMSYSSWGCKESYTTEQLHAHLIVGELQKAKPQGQVQLGRDRSKLLKYTEN